MRPGDLADQGQADTVAPSAAGVLVTVRESLEQSISGRGVDAHPWSRTCTTVSSPWRVVVTATVPGTELNQAGRMLVAGTVQCSPLSVDTATEEKLVLH